jgi:hypothetical protein
VVQLVGDERLDPVFAVDRVAHLDHLVEGGRHLEPRLLDQVVARGDVQHCAGLVGEGEGLTLGVLHLRLRAAHEIVRIPVGRRVLGVLEEGVERREPAGADPAARVDEGDVAGVDGRALGRELEVGALVVDGEGLHGEVHLDAGLLLELRKVVLEVLVVGGLEARAVDGRAVVGLAALGMDGGRGQGREGRTEGAAQDRTTTKSAHSLPPRSQATYYV